MPITHHDDVELFYETFGDEADPTLLLVNGLGSQCVNYRDEWCTMFAAHGLHVVRFDNRDVGLSSRTTEPYRLVDMAGDAFAVLDALGVDRAHVLGVSMGGMIVQTMAIAHPERVATMTSAMSSTGEEEYRRSSAKAYELLTAPAATDREGYVRGWIDGLHEWGSPEFADEARWRADAERAWDRAAPVDGGTFRQFMAVGSSGSRADGLRALRVPTLVIHGDRDTLIEPIGGRRTAELIPGARFELIEGMGHDYPPQLWERWVDLVVGHIRSQT